jgi:chromosome segregation ATPase
MSYTDEEIKEVLLEMSDLYSDGSGDRVNLSIRNAMGVIRQLLAQRDEAVSVAEAYQKDCDRANAMLEETRASRAALTDDLTVSYMAGFEKGKTQGHAQCGAEVHEANKAFDSLVHEIDAANARISELEMERDEALDEASDMRDEAYIDASAEKPISWQSMHEAECAARHAALADLAAAKARIYALEEALKPFADAAADLPDPFCDMMSIKSDCDFSIWECAASLDLSASDLIRARSTLPPKKEGE